ncbi:hypothetical protein niasHS_009318 [Heterodera schachtii]|uniref:Thioredoxin-like fold domain-containing protein n=1 Tax=Heterodera schachtii TaxID=97005 RepID=A0ABD2JBT3_HETSC
MNNEIEEERDDSDTDDDASLDPASMPSSSAGAIGGDEGGTGTPKRSPKQNWLNAKNKLKTYVYGIRRKHDYVRNLYKPSKYNMPKVWGGEVKRPDQLEPSTPEKVSQKIGKKQSEKSQKEPKNAKPDGKSTPLQMLMSKEKLLMVMMKYVEMKLEDMSKQYKEFQERVTQWEDGVQSVKAAFETDKKMYKKYMEMAVTWPEDTSKRIKKPKETPEKAQKSLKQTHLDNLAQMANKFEEFRQVVKQWPDSGCFMTFPLEKNVFNKVFLFDHALTLKEDDLQKELATGLYTHAEFRKESPADFFNNPDWSQKKLEDAEKEKDVDEDEDDDKEKEEEDDDDGEGDVRMATNALLEALLKGRDGFGKEATLDLRKLPKWEGKSYESKSMWQMAKKIVRNLIKFVTWPLRIVWQYSNKLTRKVRNAMKSKDEKERMRKMLEEVKKDDMLYKIYQMLDNSKKKAENVDEKGNKNMEKEGMKPDEPTIDHSAHEQLTDKDKQQHPFTFLQGVRYDIHVKPAEKLFEQLYPTQYDDLMEFYRNPTEFYKNKRLDEDTIFIMRKMMEPNKHLVELYKKPYYLIHDFFDDPAKFYLRGDKLDKTLKKALRETLIKMGLLDKIMQNETKTFIEKYKKEQLTKDQASKIVKLLKNPNDYLGSTEQLDEKVINVIRKAYAENKKLIKNAIIRNRKLVAQKSKSDDKTMEQKATENYEKLKAFFDDPINNKLDIKLFQIFREVMGVANDKDSNEELAELDTEQYQQFLLFLENPNEYLTNAKFDDSLKDTLMEVLDKKSELFSNLTPEQIVQLKEFKDALENKTEFQGQLDSAIFAKYRKTLPASAKKGVKERTKEFFVSTKLRFAFDELKTERQFDQLMRFFKHPIRFYQPRNLEENVWKPFRAILSKIVGQKRHDQMFNGLTDEQYDQLMELATNPANRFAPREMEEGKKLKKFKKAPGVDPEVFNLYTRHLKRNQSCADVKPLIELALYGMEDRQKASLDLRGRLGAQIISSVLNTKQFSGNMVFALVMSLVGSGGIAAALDLGLWHLVVHHVAMALGHLHPVTIIVMVLLDSLTPLFAETFDSFVIKRTLGALEGKSLLPRTFKQFKEDLKESVIAGGIAALGAIPNNIVMSLLPGSHYLMSGNIGGYIGVFALNAFTNQIAASTSAAMVPLQVEKWHKLRSAAFYKLIDIGFFPAPTKDQLITGTVNAKTVRGYCRLRAADGMQIDSVTSMAYNSMGLGAVISFFFGFVAIFIPVSYELVGDQIQRIVSIMFNTPTEILSLGAGLLTANHLGNQRYQKWLSTDYHKDKQMVQLVFEKAIEQLQDSERQFKDINFEDIYKIYHARFQLTYRFGKIVVTLMIGMKNGVEKMFKQRPLTIDQLDEQYIDKEVLVQNWKPNVVYLVQFSHADSAPSLSPAAIKLETWLRIKKIPFYTVSDGVLFRALFADDKVPFVEYNGQKIFGTSEEIIDTLKQEALSKGTLGELFGLGQKSDQNEEQMRDLIDNVLYSILLHDRFQNLANPIEKTHLANNFDFQRLVLPSVLKEAKRNWFKIQPLPKPFWDEYFAKGKKVAYGGKPWNGYGISEKEWKKLEDEVSKTKFEKLKEQESIKKKEWIKFVDNVTKEHIPKAMTKFVKHLKKQLLRQLSERPSLKFSDGTVITVDKNYEKKIDKFNDKLKKLFDETMQQIEQQLTKMSAKGKNTKFYLFGETPTALDAVLFGILSQFTNTDTIYNRHYANFTSAKLNGNPNDPLKIYFGHMKDIFMGQNNAEQNQWQINGEWKFEENANKYNGPFILRFDVLKLDYEQRTRFTDDERKTFSPMLSNGNAKNSDEISGTLFSERKFLAVYPKVVTFIVHQLLNLFNLERFAIEMAELPTVVEIRSLADYIEFIPSDSKQKLLQKLEKEIGKIGTLSEEKRMKLGRALIHLMASYLCEGKIGQNNCETEHDKKAKEYLGRICKISEEYFAELSVIVRSLVYQMMYRINVEYQTKESIKMFGAALLDLDEEQTIKYEAKRLRNAIWHLEKFESEKIEYFRKKIQQIGILMQEIQETDSKDPQITNDGQRCCEDPMIRERIEKVRKAKQQIAMLEQQKTHLAKLKYDPNVIVKKESDTTAEEIKELQKELSVWVLRSFIVSEMRALVDALDDDDKFSREIITFKDIEPSRNHWLNLNVLVEKCEKEDRTCKVDREQMKQGIQMITERKKKHIFKELWAKTVDQAESVFTVQKYHEVLSYRLGQVRKLYELRKSQLPSDELVNIKEIDEQYGKVKAELFQRLRDSEVTTTEDNGEGAEVVEVLAEVTFASKKQNITADSDRIRKAIEKMLVFVNGKADELKKMSSAQLKDEMRSEIDAVVHRTFLLKEMKNLINLLDKKEFEENTYPFAAFRESYFSGELFILLRAKVEEDGTNFDEDEIAKGFEYVKGHNSMHRSHKLRAFLFDWAGKVAKEKKFVKKLAWRMGQLSKLYMLRKKKIAEKDLKSWASKQEELSGEMEKRWTELKAKMEKRSALLSLPANEIIQNATGKKGPTPIATADGYAEDGKLGTMPLEHEL